jgi:hypothetical protein
LLLALASAFILRSESRRTFYCLRLETPTNSRSRSQTQSQSYITTHGQSASLSWNKAPILGLWPDFYFCQTVASFLTWGALSDETTGLSFTVAALPRQRILGSYCLRFEMSFFVVFYDS